MDLSLQLFWIPLLKIIWINVVLSGDNAVVIALAARSLPPRQQKLALAWGSGAALVALVGKRVAHRQTAAAGELQ